MKKWFDNSISFACTACGKCCTSGGSTKVFVNRREIQNIAHNVGLEEDLFVTKYVDERLDDSGRVLKSLKKHSTKSQCTFLSGKKCTIYKDRPTQCRTYPYWPHIMIGSAEWKGEARGCEGIQLDALSNAPHVDVDTIALNMIVHQIHDRGLGENWTYDEAVQLLQDSKVESPDLFEEYLITFFEDTESHIVHEDKVLRVVDSKALASDGGEGHIFSRRMEFVNSPALAQTEMFVSCTADEWSRWYGANSGNSVAGTADANKTIADKLDYSTLHMPVHRVMGGLCSDYLNNELEGQALRIAVIGAGCCALPACLLTRSSTREMTVHAVEPSAEVLLAAEQFFGVIFDARLQKHAQTGAQYLRSCGLHTGAPSSQTFHDVIIVDAFADAPLSAQQERSKNTGNVDAYDMDTDVVCDDAVQYAPPQEVLLDLPLLAAALTGTNTNTDTKTGLLIINVYGPPNWVDLVVQRIQDSGHFCPPLMVPTSPAAVAAAQSDGTTPLSTTDKRNVVLVTMPTAGAHVLSQIGARVDVLALLQS